MILPQYLLMKGNSQIQLIVIGYWIPPGDGTLAQVEEETTRPQTHLSGDKHLVQ